MNKKFESFVAGMKKFGVSELADDLTGENGWATVAVVGGELNSYALENVAEFSDIADDIREDFAIGFGILSMIKNPPECVAIVTGIAGNRGVVGVFAFSDPKKCAWWALSKTLAAWAFLGDYGSRGFKFAKLRNALPEVLKTKSYADGENSFDIVKFSDLLKVYADGAKAGL